MNKTIIFSLLINTIVVYSMETDKSQATNTVKSSNYNYPYLANIAQNRAHAKYKYNKKINFYLAQLLLKDGADPDYRSSIEDPTPLMVTVYNKDQKYARLLLEHNANPEKTALWVNLTTKTAFEMERTGWLKTMYDEIQQKKELKTTL